MASDRGAGGGRVGNVDASVAVGDVTPRTGVPTTVATGVPSRPSRRQAGANTASRAATPWAGSRRSIQCDIKSLAKANGLKAPRYASGRGRS